MNDNYQAITDFHRIKNGLIWKDISDRQNEFRVIKESESYFRKIINSAPVAIILTDTNGRCLFVNEFWSELTGLTPQKSIGNGWQEAIHQEDVGKIGVWFYPGEKDKLDPATECRIYSSNSGVRYVDLKTAPFYDENGILVGFITLFADISHRKT